jgi:microcystin-dependent protein
MAIVTSDIVVNQNNSTIYLRVDGSNKMQNALSFNKELNAEHRMVKYLSSITNDGDLTVDAHKVILGNQSGTKGDSNVVVNDLTIHSMGDQPLTSLLNSMPVGAVVAYAGSIAPNGFFECNGASFSNSTYPKLYQALGATTVPDLRGQFVRGWDHGRGLDPSQTRAIGSYQEDAYRHYMIHSNTAAYDHDWFMAAPAGSIGKGVVQVQISNSLHTGNGGGAETRPKNIALMYIIKHD